MKFTKTVIVASLAGLCAIGFGATAAFSAIPPHHHHHHAARRHIRHLQAAYAKAKANGHMHAAARIHAHAMAIRHKMHNH